MVAGRDLVAASGTGSHAVAPGSTSARRALGVLARRRCGMLRGCRVGRRGS